MGMRVPWRGPHWCRSEGQCREHRAGPRDKAARDREFGGSWKLQDLVLCTLQQLSPSLTLQGHPNTKSSLCPQACAQHPMCRDPALLVSTSAQGVSTALGSLSGKAMCPKGQQQLLKPKRSLEVTC